MRQKRRQRHKPQKPIESPTAWFAVLERARRIEDYELAARAKRELKRLGVTVQIEAYHE